MKFAHPTWAALFLVWIALIVIFVVTTIKQRRRISQYFDRSLQSRMVPQLPGAVYYSSAIAFLLGIAGLIVTLMGPQWGETKLKQVKRGLDLVMAVDTSKSMLAKDITPNRLARVQLELSQLVSQLSGDRVALIAFAGNAFVQCPLTSDYNAFKTFLKSLNVNMIPKGGTHLEEALNQANSLFAESKQRSQVQSQILLLLTDGEDHEGNVQEAAQKLASQGVTIITIGIGSEKGEPIPILDDQENIEGYIKNESGEVVLSKLNSEILKEISKIGNGTYIQADDSGIQINALLSYIAQFERAEQESEYKIIHTERFQLFLAPSLILIILSLAIMTFYQSKSKILFVLLTIISTNSAMALPILKGKNQNIENGNQALSQKAYDQAITHYKQAHEEFNNQKLEIFLNEGLTYSQKGDKNSARQSLERVLLSDNSQLRSRSYYLLGNTFFDEKNYEQAIGYYKKSLKENNKNQDARYNLELAKKLLEQKKKEEEKKQQEKPKNQEDQKEKKEKPEEKQENKSQEQEDKEREEKKQMMKLLDNIDNQEKAVPFQLMDQKNSQKREEKKKNVKDW